MSKGIIIVPECITKISSNVSSASQFGFPICIMLASYSNVFFRLSIWSRKLLKEDMRKNVFEVSVHSWTTMTLSQTFRIKMINLRVLFSDKN